MPDSVSVLLKLPVPVTARPVAVVYLRPIAAAAWSYRINASVLFPIMPLSCPICHF